MKRVAINGFGRMGRLAARVLEARDDLELVVVNEPFATAEVLATILEFDSLKGRWHAPCSHIQNDLVIGDRRVPVLSSEDPRELDWAAHKVDVVLECSGEFRRRKLVATHLDMGAKKVVVSVPVHDGPPNIVVGVNHDAFDLSREDIVTAASCTTNCLAPVAKVLLDGIGIKRGTVTTIHSPTNTQVVVDAPHKDSRRARASQLNLIPTSTNSATAVTKILPELEGKLDSIAVRAPVLNASLVDFVFETPRDTTINEINQLFEVAAMEGPLRDILGYEDRGLVSSDYAGDPRSGIVDGLSTRVTDGNLVKVFAWYDNEWGYVNRMVELAGMMAERI